LRAFRKLAGKCYIYTCAAAQQAVVANCPGWLVIEGALALRESLSKGSAIMCLVILLASHVPSLQCSKAPLTLRSWNAPIGCFR
jgi:hypothetical protein